MFFETCPHCGESIRADRLDKHIKKSHESAHPCNKLPRHHLDPEGHGRPMMGQTARRWGEQRKSEQRW